MTAVLDLEVSQMGVFKRFKSLLLSSLGAAAVKKPALLSGRPLPEVVLYDVDPAREWCAIEELGRGAFGKVMKVCSREDPTKLAAAKHIHIGDGEQVEDFVTEIEILSQCRHPNIIELLASYFVENKLSVSALPSLWVVAD